MGGDVAGHPVGHRLGIGACGYGRFEVFSHLPFIGEHAGVIDRQPQLIGIAMTLLGRQFRQLGPPALALLATYLNWSEIGIGEIAVVAGSLLAAHALGELFALVPEAGFLHHRLAGFVGLDLALNFIFTGLLNCREGVHVFDLHLGAEGCIGPAAHGDIHVAAQGALLHVAVTHA